MCVPAAAPHPMWAEEGYLGAMLQERMIELCEDYFFNTLPHSAPINTNCGAPRDRVKPLLQQLTALPNMPDVLTFHAGNSQFHQRR